MFFLFVAVACQPLHLLNNPMISAFASVLKCKLKPTTAADVSALTSSLSVFTAKTRWIGMDDEAERYWRS
jgi:hypothetical protein